MIDFIKILLAVIGMIALYAAICYGFILGLEAFRKASDRRQKDTRMVLMLLEKIEANTAPTDATPSTDRA